MSHRLPPWSHHRRKWLPYQRPWHVATEKQQKRPRTWWAQSTTYAKAWQLSVEYTSLARGISLDNCLHKWHAHSLLERTAYSVWIPIMRVCSFHIFPTVPACWVCCRCYMHHWFRKKTTTITQCKLQCCIQSPLPSPPPPPPPQHSYNACIQYTHHCSREKKQITSASYCGPIPASAPFRPPHIPDSICAQWLKIKPTSASFTEGQNLHRHHWSAWHSKYV